MIRGKLTPGDGSILPNKHAPWGHVYEKLVEAESGILYMRSAKDRVSFEHGWSRFVDSIEEAWIRFYAEGLQNHRRFSGWISKPNKVRQTDELLCYITQARHQSQHGVIALSWEPSPGISIGQGFTGTLSSLKVYNDGTFEADAQSAPSSKKDFAVYFDPGNAKLPTVINKKHKQSFAPPAKHLDKKLSGLDPIVAAELTMRYYRSVIDAAKSELG